MAKAAYGISNAKMGATGANGAMGTSLVDITQIVADSVQLTFPEPEITDIIPEEYDGPFVSLETKGVKTIELDTLNVDVADLPKFFGGATATGTFTPGVQFSIGEQSFQFTTRVLQAVKQTWKFPRCAVYASIDANPSKTNTINIHLQFRVLTPVDAGGAQLADFSVVQA